jgi:hypothetical protein
MPIDFTNSPASGSTYTYLGVTYTFIKDGANPGYWAVSTPGSIGPASVAEINAGTEATKYITSSMLYASNYLNTGNIGTSVLAPTGDGSSLTGVSASTKQAIASALQFEKSLFGGN